MVLFRPFRGWRYDPEVVGDLASVLCPPYDLIGRELEESLAQQSPYNAVHLEGAERPDWQLPAHRRYAQAADLFTDWRRQGVLRRDPEPCYYLLRHRFPFEGQTRSRLSLFGAVGLEDYERRQVLPHEFTEEPAVNDRVSLMESCGANFSPIMSLYRDATASLSPVFQEVMTEPPAIDARDPWGQESAFWPISNRRRLEAISRTFEDNVIFLADGHHRYEAALRLQKKHFQAEGSAASSGPDSTAAHNFVMMSLIEFDDPGLVVLPYHRVIGGLTPPKLAQLRERLDRLFEAQPVELGADGGHNVLLEQVARHGQGGRIMGLVGPPAQGQYLLTLREEVDLQQWGPLAVAESWILEEQVLKPVLGEAVAGHVRFSHDHQDALAQVASGAQQLAFLLRPFPMDQFESIVSTGQRLPSKSTFFFPKLPTGLVINQLEGAL